MTTQELVEEIAARVANGEDFRDLSDEFWQRVWARNAGEGLGAFLVPKPQPTFNRVAPPIAAQHTMRAQAILALGDTTKHQNLAIQHLEAAFQAANPGWE